MKQCPNCGKYIDDNAAVCYSCGAQQPPVYHNHWQGASYGAHQRVYGDNCFDDGPEGKSRGVAALLAILLGGIGVQYFYLGKIGGGFLTILLTIVTCGLWKVVMLIQGILMFCMTNEEFRRKYVLNNSTLPLF